MTESEGGESGESVGERENEVRTLRDSLVLMKLFSVPIDGKSGQEGDFEHVSKYLGDFRGVERVRDGAEGDEPPPKCLRFGRVPDGIGEAAGDCHFEVQMIIMELE